MLTGKKRDWDDVKESDIYVYYTIVDEAKIIIIIYFGQMKFLLMEYTIYSLSFLFFLEELM